LLGALQDCKNKKGREGNHLWWMVTEPRQERPSNKKWSKYAGIQKILTSIKLITNIEKPCFKN
jgi:hypothetical protein